MTKKTKTQPKSAFLLSGCAMAEMWPAERIEALVSAGRLTREEADEVMLPNGNADREEDDTIQRKEVDG